MMWKLKYEAKIVPRFHLICIHDAKGLLELLDGSLWEQSKDIAATALCFPSRGVNSQFEMMVKHYKFMKVILSKNKI